MNADALEALLNDLESQLADDVAAQLALTADEFATALSNADELTAASFKVSKVGDMWRRRVPKIMQRLRKIAGRGAVTVVDDLDADDIPSADLDAALKPYTEATEALVNAVGDRLAAEAVKALADGTEASESVEQLQRRLVDLFTSDPDGTQLGHGRAQRIAATEATRAFNAGVLAAAEALTGPERPLVKQWQTRRDTRVREPHADADGQLRLLDEAFEVGGVPMQYPGDPTAPANLTVNCRCILRVEAAQQTASAATDGEGEMSEDTEAMAGRMPPALKAYWIGGPGAAKIGWGTPGSFERCTKELGKEVPADIDVKGLCANLYHDATGDWPGRKGGKMAVNPDGTEHTGAMVALLPSDDDLGRLALLGDDGSPAGEPADQLHLTLFYLGDGADWSDDTRNEVISNVAAAARYLAPVEAYAFGTALWNPASDEPAHVWNVGDGEIKHALADVRYEVQYALENRHGGPDMPEQHSPWQPHICAAYGELSDAQRGEMQGRCGAVTFDRIAVAFGGQWTVMPLTGNVPVEGALQYDEGEALQPTAAEPMPDVAVAEPVAPPVARWSTPEGAALAFENQQTGDGRVFTPGALKWGTGPWPLQYCDTMLEGHSGARLAGAIEVLGRNEARLVGNGPLYLTQPAGVEAALLLAQGAPLGVSVDLADVDADIVVVDGEGVPVEGEETYKAHLLTASVLPLPDGGYVLTGETAPEELAAGAVESTRVTFTVGPDGRIPAAAFQITAAAGDSAFPAGGVIVDQQRSGDVLMRITSAQVRGATLVAIPAFEGARIVLDADSLAMFASAAPSISASAQSDYDRVVRHVTRTSLPSTAASVARYLKISISAARRHLARAARKGDIVKIHRGAYVAPPADGGEETVTAAADVVDDLAGIDSLTASAVGTVDLPVAAQDAEWDGDAAAGRVFEWADGDTAKIARAFAYRDDDADPATKGAYKLGYADVVDGALTIVPKGVSAALGALNGARGGVDIPASETGAVRSKLEAVQAHVAEVNGGDGRDKMEASAWSALKDLPPMPASWFAEPTVEELPPGGPGVNYSNGRIFGWVAQAGEPHAGYARKITIDTLGKIDTTHFLRQRFTLDDGSTVKAGAFTMNVGHHRDGGECETAACQFDDTRTVAGIVTVGMNERGMWFSGAAAPWLSEWDRQVFSAVQPSYNMRKGPSGNWQLRAVLSVPVPGHSSPLLASAVVDRANVTLTAAATIAETEAAIAAEETRRADEQNVTADALGALDYDRLADALVAAMARDEERKRREAEELAELKAAAEQLG
ncbi:capsid maturation protease and MuF-like fusion protein [Streptomyces phage Mischief19]|nr:capsid maturation protease and MuF-like fusion protein [Streptomyces phage Mischief19]